MEMMTSLPGAVGFSSFLLSVFVGGLTVVLTGLALVFPAEIGSSFFFEAFASAVAGAALLNVRIFVE
jgi:hypothetical protein